MGATAGIVAAIAATGSAAYGIYQAHQDAKQAQSVADSEKTMINDQIAKQNADQASADQQKQGVASANNVQAINAIRAVLSAKSSSGGTVLGGLPNAPTSPGSPTGTGGPPAPSPTTTKTLLGV